ncbi:MAG: hypothetical protein ACPGWR_03560 [Ardenticatenaceae bacterium]
MKNIKTYLIGIVVLLVSFALMGQIKVSTAVAQEDSATPTATPTKTEESEVIQFLDKEDSLEFIYSNLKNNQKIRVSVLNSSSKPLTIAGEIRIIGLLESESDSEQQPIPTSTPFPNPVDLDFNDDVEIENNPSSKITTLSFTLNRSSSTPKNGTYKGFIIVTAFDGDTLVGVIQKSFTLQVGEPSAPLADPEKIEIIRPQENHTYDLHDIKSGREPIFIVIKNGGVTTEIVDVKIDFLGTSLYDEKKGISLPSGQVTTLTFCLSQDRLTHAPATCPSVESLGEKVPAFGEYDGFISLKFSDKTTKHTPIKLTVSSSKTIVDQVKNWVQSWAQKSRWPFSLGTVEWAFLAFLLLIVVRRLIKFYYWWRGKPGTVKITFNDKSGDQDLNPEGERMVMQERLAKASVLPPSPVPGDSIAEDLINVLETNEAITTTWKWLTALMRLFQKVINLRPGHIVNGTFLVREQEPKKGLIIEIMDRQSGKIETIKPFWKETHREAVESAACFVYHHVTSHSHVIRKLPVWAHFPSDTVFELYQRGLMLEEAKKFEEAKKAYEAAAAGAPNNALIRYRFGNLMESQYNFKYLDAMEAYLEVVSTWPDLLEARYRLAAVFSFDKKLMEEWATATTEQKEKLRSLISTVCKKHNFSYEIKYSYVDECIIKLAFTIASDMDRDILALLELAKNQDLSSIESQRAKIKKEFDDLKGILENELEQKLRQVDTEEIPEEAKQNLKTLLKLAILLNFDLSNFFLDLASQQWKYLHGKLVWQNLWLIFPGILFPNHWTAEKAYHRKFAWPIGKRRKFLKLVEYASYCTDLRKYELNKYIDASLIINEKFYLPNLQDEASISYKKFPKPHNLSLCGRILRKFHGIDYQVRYNAVCFYSIAMGVLKGKKYKNTRQRFEDKAFNQLNNVIQDPENRLSMDWLKKDPDLKVLQDTPRFKALFGVKEKKPKSPDQVKVEKLCHSWDVLRAAAKYQEDAWYNRWLVVKDFNVLISAEIEPWRKTEKELWEKVHTLAADPENDKKRSAFWKSVKEYHPNAGEMPKATMTCHEEYCNKHDEKWKELSNCVLPWIEHLHDMPDDNLKIWVQQQWTLWQSMRYWTESPLEDALFFRFKSKLSKGNLIVLGYLLK